MLQKKPDVTQRLGDGTTALEWAVRWNELDIARQLIKAGADVNSASLLGATPLYLAALNGSAPMIKALLDARANPNQQVLAAQATPLMYAARSGDTQSALLLLKAGADINAREGYRGTTALMWAAERGNEQMVSLLLAHGADATVNSRTYQRTTSGKAPKTAFNPQQADVPLNPSADTAKATPAVALPPRRPQGAASVTEMQGGVTALALAARENALGTVKALLDGHAPINQQTGDGSTALLVAIQNENLAMARLLLERGADVHIANLKGWTPLYIAVKNRTLEYGNMPPPAVGRDEPPLIDRDELFKLIEELLARGADVNARIKSNTDMRNAVQTTWVNEAGATAFFRASLCGDLPVMELLLKHGADPKIATDDGTTALAGLAGVGYGKGLMNDFGNNEMSMKAMRLLVGLGLDVNAANAENVSPLAGAAHKNFVDAIQLLVDHGADLTVVSHHRGQFERRVDFKGDTVLDWAYGVMTGGEAPLSHPEAIALVEKLMKERNLPLIRFESTDGGIQGASQSALAAQGKDTTVTTAEQAKKTGI